MIPGAIATMRQPVNVVATILTTFVVGLASGQLHAGDEWPAFRGPDGQGHAPSGHIPARFSEGENVLWKAAIPGRGWASPVMSNGVCWLATAVTEELTGEEREQFAKEKLKGNPLAKEMELISRLILRAVAVDLESGKILHDVELFQHANPEPIHSLNSYASPTPVLKDGRLYCHFGNLGTACVDTKSGKVLWKTRFPVEHSVGPGSSPVIFENLLIFPCDGTTAQYVVALNLADGEPVWKVNRPPMTGDNGDFHKAFSSPLLLNDGKRDQVVITGAQWVVSYDPHDGKTLWQVRHGEGFSNAPAPVYADGVAIICTGYMTPELVAIRVNGSGDVTNSHVLWKIKKQVPAMPSPIVIGKAVYMVSDQGVVSCADVATGDVKFQKRIPGSYSASPMVADGKLMFLSREGDVTVVEAKADWKELSKNHLDGKLMASPAMWKNSLILRSDTHLYRITNRQVAKADAK